MAQGDVLLVQHRLNPAPINISVWWALSYRRGANSGTFASMSHAIGHGKPLALRRFKQSATALYETPHWQAIARPVHYPLQCNLSIFLIIFIRNRPLAKVTQSSCADQLEHSSGRIGAGQ